MNKHLSTHNLDIHMYKFNEILELFGLSYQLNLDDLKRAKNVVLKTHPDKSGLSSEYFLFYKKAFEMVLQYYNENHKYNILSKKWLMEENIISSSNYKSLKDIYIKNVSSIL